MAGYIATAGNVDWCTPKTIVDVVKEALGGKICLDPCSNKDSIVGAEVNYILPANDGLMDSWEYETIYVNPPYGKCYMKTVTKEIIAAKEYQQLTKEQKKEYTVSSLSDWMGRCAKAYDTFDSEVIALIPATVDTKTWQDNIFLTATAICFIRGRVKFNGAEQSAPMPVCLVYWGGRFSEFEKACDKLGRVVCLVN